MVSASYFTAHGTNLCQKKKIITFITGFIYSECHVSVEESSILPKQRRNYHLSFLRGLRDCHGRAISRENQGPWQRHVSPVREEGLSSAPGCPAGPPACVCEGLPGGLPRLLRLVVFTPRFTGEDTKPSGPLATLLQTDSCVTGKV